MVRKDKLKNKVKVVKKLVVNPILTDREIESLTGVSKSTSNRIRNELGQDGTKDIDIMDRILKTDDAIIDLANQITLRKIINEAPKDEDGNIIVDDLSLQDIKIIGDYANNSTKRKAIFMKKDEGVKETIFNINL